MRILVSTTTGFGHFTPLVPLAAALQARGHELRVASEPAFGGVVQRHGLDHVSVGLDLTLDDVLGALPEIFEIPPEAQDAYARPRVFVGLRAMNVVADLVDVVATWEPDVVIRESGELAAWAVAERSSISHVAVNVGVATSAEDWQAMGEPWLRDLGDRIGLDDLAAASMYRHGLLSFEPAGYHDWTGVPAVSTFRPAAVSQGGQLGNALLGLDDRPLVYVTLGTELYNADLMASMLDGLADGDWNVVATTGPAGDPVAVDPRRPNVIVAAWLPQDSVLDQAAAVVTHAGAGTVIGSLVRGLPVVCVPQGADQFHHGRRVDDLGVGINLGTLERSPEQLRAAVTAVLSEPGYRNRSEQVAAATACLPGVDDAATLVEHLVATRTIEP